MNTPVYLRDLGEMLQREARRDWERNGLKDLIRAYEEGKDITIGYYIDAEVE